MWIRHWLRIKLSLCMVFDSAHLMSYFLGLSLRSFLSMTQSRQRCWVQFKLSPIIKWTSKYFFYKEKQISKYLTHEKELRRHVMERVAHLTKINIICSLLSNSLTFDKEETPIKQNLNHSLIYRTFNCLY